MSKENTVLCSLNNTVAVVVVVNVTNQRMVITNKMEKGMSIPYVLNFFLRNL